MKVTISLDFDAIKEDICNEFCNRLIGLDYTEDQIDVLERSFMENIDGGFMDATFEIEMNNDETEVTSCVLIGE
jgi:hypothetical protein